MTGPDPGTSPTPGAPPPAAPPPPPPTDWAAASAPPPAATVPGQAGLVYADVPNRIIAQIIDFIVVGVVGLIAGLILFAIVGSPITFSAGTTNVIETNWIAVILSAIVGTALSAGYYIYTWTRMRGTIGQRALGMQVGNASDGASLTMEQAVKRWLALGGIFSLAQFLNPLPLLGLLLALASLIWVIYLLVTTAQSPTKQGFHDKFAGSVVVKAARTVG